MSLLRGRPEPGKVRLIVQTPTRYAACEVDLGDDGTIRPLVMHTALDEAIKGLQG